MKNRIKIKFEESKYKIAILPEINFAWRKGYYFFISVSWLRYTLFNYNFIKI